MTKSCLLDVFQYAPLPEQKLGTITDTCIGFMRNLVETIAVRAFSIIALLRIVVQYSELCHEVVDVIQELHEHDSAAVQVRLREALKTMEKISSGL